LVETAVGIILTVISAKRWLMRLRFWRRRSSRQRALDAIAQARRHPLVKPGPVRTPGSANDLYWALQGGMYGQPW
jgi:hypothetical protein